MSNHFIHYIRRRITLSGSNDCCVFEYGNQNVDDGIWQPNYHITRKTNGVILNVEIGSVIWIFSVLCSPWGKIGPSLDAKIVVENVEKTDEGKFKFIANKESLWFPLCNASAVLTKLETVDKKGTLSQLITDNEKPLGIYLQSLRQLSNSDILINWSNKIIESKYDFISYRIADGIEKSFYKAKELFNENINIFWDRFSLPRRLAERREFIDDKNLDEFILFKIDNCDKVWGVETPKYAEKESYSFKEMEYAKKRNKYSSVKM